MDLQWVHNLETTWSIGYWNLWWRFIGMHPLLLRKQAPRETQKWGRDSRVSVGTTPHPVTVTTRIISFLVGNPYKPSFVTVTGRGPHPRYLCSDLYFAFKNALCPFRRLCFIHPTSVAPFEVWSDVAEAGGGRKCQVIDKSYLKLLILLLIHWNSTTVG